jgi:hypothetical protein
MKTTNREIKEAQQFSSPTMGDEECVARLAEGYKQSFDGSRLITWDEMGRRLDRLF